MVGQTQRYTTCADANIQNRFDRVGDKGRQPHRIGCWVVCATVNFNTATQQGKNFLFFGHTYIIIQQN